MWQLPRLAKKVYAGVGGLIILLVGAIAYQYLLAQPAPQWYQPSTRPQSRQPVYLRLGTVVSLGQGSFQLRTAKLAGAGGEVITVRLAPSTRIIEIQVPEVITPAHEQVLQAGGRVIERVPVSPEKLKVDQNVAVVAGTDMFGLQEVEAERVEYQVLVP